MAKLDRSERLVLMMKILADHPGGSLPLSLFMDRFQVAKSTVSEDLALIKRSLELDGAGLLQTSAGAAGGVRYWPVPSAVERNHALTSLCQLLREPNRILPGGFIYMTDLLTHPVWSARIGEILAARFLHVEADAVLTIETKGIPIAHMVARALGVPMVVARREGRVTEGPSFSIHYISGESRRIHTMTVGLRALRRESRVLVIDDFMKAGAAARGLVDLATELGATVVGVGVFVSTATPEKKRVERYESLLRLLSVNEEERTVEILPTRSPEE